MPLINVPVFIAFDCKSEADATHAVDLTTAVARRVITVRLDTESGESAAQWTFDHPPRDGSAWFVDEGGVLLGLLSPDAERLIERRAARDPAAYGLVDPATERSKS